MPSGIELKLATVKASTWGTPAVAGASDGVLMLAGSVKKTRNSLVDDSLGLFWPQDSTPAEIKVGGNRPFYMRYDSLDQLIALFMGTSSSPTYTTPNCSGNATAGGASSLTNTGAGWTVSALVGKFITITGGTGIGQTRFISANTATVVTVSAAWTTPPDATSQYAVSGLIADHIYDLADKIDGLFATFALNKIINIEEAPSVKICGLNLKGGVGKPLTLTLNLIANDLNWNSATNTLATFANVTFIETANRVMFNQAVFRLNAQAGAALAPGDIIGPSDFELDCQRKMSGIYGSGGVFNTIDEPTNDGVPQVKLKLTFPRYTSASYFTDWDADTAKKADIVFTGALLGGATNRQLKIFLPNLKYSTVDSAEKPGIIDNSVEFNALGALVAPNGMTGITKPFRMELINGYGGDPLQAGN